MYKVGVLFNWLELTNAMEQSPSWKACSFLITEEIASM
jgi:hypothetical protein